MRRPFFLNQVSVSSRNCNIKPSYHWVNTNHNNNKLFLLKRTQLKNIYHEPQCPSFVLQPAEKMNSVEMAKKAQNGLPFSGNVKQKIEIMKRRSADNGSYGYVYSYGYILFRHLCFFHQYVENFRVDNLDSYLHVHVHAMLGDFLRARRKRCVRFKKISLGPCSHRMSFACGVRHTHVTHEYRIIQFQNITIIIMS